MLIEHSTNNLLLSLLEYFVVLPCDYTSDLEALNIQLMPRNRYLCRGQEASRTYHHYRKHLSNILRGQATKHSGNNSDYRTF